MDPLATPDDIEARLGRPLTLDEESRVDSLLADASANVRRVSTQMFTLVADDEVTLRRGRHGKVRLPQRPVVSVTSVEDINGNDVAYRRVNEVLNLNVWPLNSFEIEPYRYGPPDEVVVTYTHGGDVPDQIVGVVCSVVARALGQTPTEAGVIQESIDGYSQQFGSVGAQGPLGMLASERETCEAFRRPSSPILMDA
jgi:hypothetical protein